MDKVKEIVKKLYDKESTPECLEYKLIKFLRETCDSSQEKKDSLKSLVENLMCLAVLKGKKNSFVYTTYKRLCYILVTIYSDVGLPPNVIDIFKFPNSNYTLDVRDQVIYTLGNSIYRRFPPYCWKYCQLSRLEGIGKKSIINIVHWSLHGTLPELKNIEFKKDNPNNDVRNSQKDLLIKQLQDSVKRLVEDNRSLRGTEEVEECSICLESEGTLVPSKCDHKFHTECLIKWLENNNTCPNCRINLVE